MRWKCQSGAYAVTLVWRCAGAEISHQQAEHTVLTQLDSFQTTAGLPPALSKYGRSRLCLPAPSRTSISFTASFFFGFFGFGFFFFCLPKRNGRLYLDCVQYWCVLLPPYPSCSVGKTEHVKLIKATESRDYISPENPATCAEYSLSKYWFLCSKILLNNPFYVKKLWTFLIP